MTGLFETVVPSRAYNVEESTPVSSTSTGEASSYPRRPEGARIVGRVGELARLDSKGQHPPQWHSENMSGMLSASAREGRTLIDHALTPLTSTEREDCNPCVDGYPTVGGIGRGAKRANSHVPCPVQFQSPAGW